MNNITSPELLSQVCSENKELLTDFLDYLTSIQRSAGTINGYKNDIEIAWIWCLKYNNNIPFINWTKRHVIRYQNWLLNENGNSPARVKRLKASLSSLGNYIENVLDDEYPNFRNIINKVESPVNQPVRDKTVLSDKQLRTLLDTLTDTGKYDKACAVALAAYSGRRKSELLRFRVDDFTEDRLVCGGALYKSKKIKTKGRGAQGKQLECFCLAKQFDPYLDRWLDYRKQKGIESEWLFPDKENPEEQMKITTLNSWAETFSKILGVDFYWHSMRHFTITSFIRAGIPDSVIQQYIGWADISMVPVYSDIEADGQLSMYFTADGIVTPKKVNLTDI